MCCGGVWALCRWLDVTALSVTWTQRTLNQLCIWHRETIATQKRHVLVEKDSLWVCRLDGQQHKSDYDVPDCPKVYKLFTTLVYFFLNIWLMCLMNFNWFHIYGIKNSWIIVNIIYFHKSSVHIDGQNVSQLRVAISSKCCTLKLVTWTCHELVPRTGCWTTGDLEWLGQK